MLDDRRALALYAAALMAALALGGKWLAGREAPTAPVAQPEIRLSDDRPEQITVHLAGEVRRPGVYRLRTDARVDDAVRRAGGPTAAADLTQVNLAAKVQDGRQIVLPARADTGAPGAGGTGARVPGVPLNINTATVEQLDALDGIGPATAEQIVQTREERGGFGSVDELGDVPGIGEKRLATLREDVRV